MQPRFWERKNAKRNKHLALSKSVELSRKTDSSGGCFCLLARKVHLPSRGHKVPDFRFLLAIPSRNTVLAEILAHSPAQSAESANFAKVHCR